MPGKSELLNLLGEVKARVQDKLGAVNFPLPQFILIGKQSVGKSRLIETLAGEEFNFISGTMGSRRPTVLEFRHVPTDRPSQWSVRNTDSGIWDVHPVKTVMELVGKKHEECGNGVSADPIYVRVESKECVDMTIVDLPGFRDFALDDAGRNLGLQIDELVSRFMKDTRNVMLCVEQAADAATMSTLSKCKQVDPHFERTILIRSKLDKYYNDLTPENATAWVNGHGDLPDNLKRFALTLPWWSDGVPPPKPFRDMRDEANNEDIRQLTSRGLNPKFIQTIGFKHFASNMENKIEQMFAAAVGPVLEKLVELRTTTRTDLEHLKKEHERTIPDKVLSTTRENGVCFAQGLVFVMEGKLGLQPELRLDEELVAFHDHFKNNDDFSKVPSEDFAGVQDYLDYLKDEAKLPSFDVPLNGGSQFRRLMSEVEIFLRFSEIAVETKKRDVIQARGVSLSSLTWKDVVVKLLGNEAHLPLQRRVRYVGERIRWFFVNQKEPTLDFMTKCGRRDDRNLSQRYPVAATMIQNNEITKHLLYDAWDKTCERQLDHFLELFDNMLASTFSNPWVFLKAATVQDTEEEDHVSQYSPEEATKRRIPMEIKRRAGTEAVLGRWFNEIPTESSQIDEAVDRVQMLVLKTYSYIRSQVCDQVEIFSESFFKVPMMRQLEAVMSNIELSDKHRTMYESRRDKLQGEISVKEDYEKEIQYCVDQIESFRLSSETRRSLT